MFMYMIMYMNMHNTCAQHVHVTVSSVMYHDHLFCAAYFGKKRDFGA